MHEEVPEGRDRITELKYERIHLQQKTFTKWMNAFLEKSNNPVTNIFEDLADGVSLLKLLEEITGEKIGNARKSSFQNSYLDFYRFPKYVFIW